MVGNILKLKFADTGPGLTKGSAWVICAGVEITQDCGSFAELDYRLKMLEADIESVRKKARSEFNRVQGGSAT